VAFLLEQGIEIKVPSGDSPQTVAAITRDVGIPVGAVAEGASIPEDLAARRRFAGDATVVGRISPDGTQAIVQELRDEDRYVAMVGDGVNDVPARTRRACAVTGQDRHQTRGNQRQRVGDRVTREAGARTLAVACRAGRRLVGKGPLRSLI
jgi:soluble P-type ATPase